MTTAVSRILVVDDEPAIRFALQAFLTALSYDVDCAESMERAIGYLDEKSYHALLVDLRLWGSDDVTGLEVVAMARRRLPDCHIIVLTAYATPEMERRARCAGADDFLSKPQPLPELVARVRRELDRPKELTDTRRN